MSAFAKWKTRTPKRNLLSVSIVTSAEIERPSIAKLGVHCINVRSVKNKAISVSDVVISRDIDILALTGAVAR